MRLKKLFIHTLPSSVEHLPRSGFSVNGRVARARWERPKSYYTIYALIIAVMLALLGVLLWFLLRPSPAQSVKTLVTLDYAKYQGLTLPSGVTQWIGIRYAEPPVGKLRFAAPQDPTNEKDVQTASQNRPACLGTNTNPPDERADEDCLFLNVYAPPNVNTKSKLPVFFYVEGGGFNGAGRPPNGTGLIEASQNNMIFVGVQYRVSLYGFLASSELQKNASVNVGLLDQRKALEWVQKYISLFGGDPGHVVLGGDSAGAASITLQLAAYGGHDYGLFHGSACESQSFATVRNVSTSQYQYDDLVKRTDCAGATDSLACLRGLNTTFLQEQNIYSPFPNAPGKSLYPYGPVIDDDVIRDYTISAFSSGRFIKLPAIYGDVTNEGTIFAPRNTSTSEDFDNFLLDTFPLLTKDQLTTIRGLYPVGTQYEDTGKYWSALAAAYGEMRYICPGIALSNAYDQYDVQKNFNYQYNATSDAYMHNGLGVVHIAESGPLFSSSTKPANGSTGPDGPNADIVPIIQSYWTSFIRSFDPSKYRHHGSPEWDRWNRTSMRRIRLQVQDGGTTMESVDAGQKSRCETLLGFAAAIGQ